MVEEGNKTARQPNVFFYFLLLKIAKIHINYMQRGNTKLTSVSLFFVFFCFCKPKSSEINSAKTYKKK